MPAPDYLTWDGGEGTLPRRPSTDDLGGDTKLDNDEKPPDDVEHFTAGGWNQKVKQIAALAAVSASCKLEVRFATGAPFVNRVAAPGSAVTRATFSPTDNGTGDSTITWPANTFPPFAISPNGLTFYSTSTHPVTGHVEEVTNGIRVRTFDNGVAADVPWSLNLN